MKANWDEIPDADDFSPIPDGEYLATVVAVEERQSTGGNPQWNLKFSVAAGEHKGRTFFDNITWSDVGMKRVKLVLSRLGLELKGEQEVTPGHLEGRSAWVTVTTNSYFSEKHQKEMTNNKVAFAGYRRAEGGAATPSVAETSDVPF